MSVRLEPCGAIASIAQQVECFHGKEEVLTDVSSRVIARVSAPEREVASE